MQEPKRTLVTGATGFLGACLLHRLVSTKNEVHIVTRRESNKWRILNILERVVEHTIDLRNRSEVVKFVASVRPEVIYHFAAYGGHPFERDPERIFQTNVMGTMNLLKACSNIEYDCFVNIGSSSEYGKKDSSIKETDVLEPRDDYAVSKASSTLYCWSVSQTEHRPIVTLRLFSPYGYLDTPTRLIPYVVLSCLRRRAPEILSPDSVRDYVFIEDVLNACIDVVDCPEAFGTVLNVGSGTQRSVREVVKEIIQLTKSDVDPVWSTSHCSPDEPKVWVADISKIKSVLNWMPKHDLHSGLSKTVAWFRQNIGLYE